jgi:two-component system sensor histidine kinase MprB
MEIQRRITSLTAACVGLAVLLASAVAYVAVRDELYKQLDGQLVPRFARPFTPGVVGGPDPALMRDRLLGLIKDPAPSDGGPIAYLQYVAPGGETLTIRGDVSLPVDNPTLQLAGAGTGELEPATVQAGDTRLRVAAVALPEGGALQFARPLAGTDHVLSRLRLVLLFVLAGGVGLAVFLARRVGGQFSGVLGDLERSNAALDSSLRAQRQLVADASHELRTPVTSLRTNVEVLLDGDELDPQSRAQLLEDMREQSEELSALVADVIELARGDAQAPDPQDLRIDELAEEAVARARRHAPADVKIVLHAQPATLAGVPDRLGRANNNLLDNAESHAPPGTIVEVGAGPAGVVVRDHGAGIAEADLPHLFDRFYRGVRARGEQGTGLGLAIVRQVAEAHGGSVSARNAEGGGAEFRLALPGRALPLPVPP